MSSLRLSLPGAGVARGAAAAIWPRSLPASSSQHQFRRDPLPVTPRAKRRSPENRGLAPPRHASLLVAKRRGLSTTAALAGGGAGGGGAGGGAPPPPPPPRRRPTAASGDDGDDDDRGSRRRKSSRRRHDLGPGTAAASAFAALAGWAAWDTLPTAGVDESALAADLTVVIPCLNESVAIERTLALVAAGGWGGGGGGGGDEKTPSAAAARLSPPPLEVIVVDGGSTDGTADIAERFAERHNREVAAALRRREEEEEEARRGRQKRGGGQRERERLGGAAADPPAGGAGQPPPILPPPPPTITVVRLGRRGRAVQMNAGAALARGELLAFLHADTEPPRDLVAASRGWFRDRRNVVLGFVPSIEVDSAWLEARRRWRAARSGGGGGRGGGGGGGGAAGVEASASAAASAAAATAGGDSGGTTTTTRTTTKATATKAHVLLAQSAHNAVKTLLYPALLRPTAFARGLRLLFGDQVLVVRAADLRDVGGYDERYAIMEDADLCLRLHKRGPYRGHSGDGGGGGASTARTATTTAPAPEKKPPTKKKKTKREVAAAAEDLRGWARQPTEAAFEAAPWFSPRGRVRMDCRRVARTSGRRLAAWGFLRGSVTNFRIASAWYFLHSPERVRDLYRRLYTDAYR